MWECGHVNFVAHRMSATVYKQADGQWSEQEAIYSHPPKSITLLICHRQFYNHLYFQFSTHSVNILTLTSDDITHKLDR